MFYERGFWMFSTGHRLGDLRRLIRQYGRAPDAVFPTGTYFKGGPFGPAVNMPIPLDEQNNPHFVHCMNTSARGSCGAGREHLGAPPVRAPQYGQAFPCMWWMPFA